MIRRVCGKIIFSAILCTTLFCSGAVAQGPFMDEVGKESQTVLDRQHFTAAIRIEQKTVGYAEIIMVRVIRWGEMVRVDYERYGSKWFSIFRHDLGVVWILNAQDETYVELLREGGENTEEGEVEDEEGEKRLTEILSDSPWVGAEDAHLKIVQEKTGKEIIRGQSCEKYRVIIDDRPEGLRREFFRWDSLERGGFPVRWESEELETGIITVFEVLDIRGAKERKELFEIPSEYEKENWWRSFLKMLRSWYRWWIEL